MTINFNVDPYFDDYEDAKGFLRVLFRPSYSVQARELTQLQTILQEQVSRFGDHIFKNGSMVIPGSVNVDNKVHFMKLDDLFNNESVTSYLTQFRSKIVTGETSGVKAVVIDTSECSCMVPGDSDIPTLYFKIEDTAADGTTKRFIPGETITALAADNTTTNNYRLETNQANDISVSIRTFGDNGNVGTSYAGDEVTDVLGYGYGVEVKQGIYYVDGFFVQNEELHLYIGRFNNTPTARVGFEVVEEIVTPEEDPSLLDNAQGSNNFVAPGAHRYKIDLQLRRLPVGSIDEIKFIELLRVVNGRVQHKVEKATYSEIEKTFARRTFDESGNYEVNKFRLSVREHLSENDNGGVYPVRPDTNVDPLQTYGNEDQIVLVIDPGKAYVNGYEVEGTISQFIAVDKARPVNGDEGGHIVRLDDQPIATQVGNYVLVTKVLGDPSIEDYVQLYLYDGTSDQNIAGTDIGTATNQTKSAPIGTARVRGIELSDTNYTSPATYRLSLFDIHMDEGYTFERDVRWMTDTPNNPVPFTVYIEVDHENGSKIAVDGSIAATSTGSTITGSGTRFVDDFKIGDPVYGGTELLGWVTAVNSQTELVFGGVQGSGTVSNVLGEQIFRGISRLNEADKSSLIFPTGYDATRTLLGYDTATGQDVIKSSTQVVRRQQTISSDLNSVVTLQLANQNEFFLSESDLENFFLIDQTTNEVEVISSSDISFVNPATRKEVTINVSNPSRSYFFIYSVLQVNAAASARTKQKATTTQTFTTRKNSTAKRLKLGHADIFEIVSVKMNAGDFDQTDFSNAIDITDRYRLDNGQRATHYQAGEAILKDGATSPSGSVQIEYVYYAYGNAGNYFSVDSYVDTDYEDIPAFEIQTSTGNTITTFLHDAIDYRPVIEGANAYHPELPKIGTDFNTSISYYVPRQDKIVLDSVGRVNVVKGVPSINPRQPEDPKEGMVLATLLMPAYTKNSADVKIFQRDNRRYTMKDIGNIERRVANLEYYVSLNMLEKETQAYTIKDGVTGLDRFKNGFIVDPFLGHGIGDVQHPDYRISVDKSKGVLRPMHFTEAVEIIENLESTQQRTSRNYQRTGDILTLPYTEERFIFNPNGSRTIDVNPYKIGAFKGEVTLNPAGDNWKETDRRPDLQVSDDNGFDAIQYLAEELGVTGTEWEEWQNNWTGRSVERERWETGNRNQRRQTVTGYERTTVTETGTASREGIRTSLTSSVNSMDYGDRIVDVSYMPYIRPRPVLYTVKNLKANTRFFSFFDDTRVDAEYIQPADIFKVTKQTGAVQNVWNPTLVNNQILADSTARAYNGEIQPSYSIGDVIRNPVHLPVVIQSIANVTNPTGAQSFSLTVADATGISVGHHVELYNLAPERTSPSAPSLDAFAGRSFRTTITNPTKNTSREINRKRFLVSNVSGTTVTLRNIDGTLVEPFSAYDSTAYAAGDGARLQRLQASGVVAFEGVAESDDTKFIHVVNIKNGFAIGENISGDADIGGGSRNQAVLNEINGNSVNTSLPVMKKVGDAIRTDLWGSCVGTFFIPEGTFRTGERSLKFIDNISNSDADFDSKGTAIYAATGLTLAKERTVVNSRDIQFVEDRLYEEIPIRRTTTSTRQLYSFYTGHDPVAQTFVVSSEGGAMVSSVDVYFSEAGNRPITVEFRTTNNGVPTSKIIPFTTSTKNPEEINVSDDGSVPTNFKFAAPVYLLDNETYALVVKTDEPGCQMFVSELGKTDIVTQNIITSQPLTGSLYLSQNSREFEVNPLLDMKFTMYRCEFDTSIRATVELKATPPLNANLVRDPFEFAPNSSKVRVYHRNHGFSAGDTVVISEVADGFYGASSNLQGAPAPLLNGSHTVQSDGITNNSFIIELATQDANGNSLLTGTIADFVNGRYGGVGVKATRQLWADYQFIKSNDVAFQDTTLQWYVDAEDASGSRTGYQATLANETHEFPNRQIVKSFENQRILTQSPLIKAPSLKIRANMSSGNSAVSPIIDLQKLSVYAIQNLIDNQNADALNVDELDSKVILNDNTIVAGDAVLAGTGTITSSNSTNTVTGVGTKFETEVRVGDIIRSSAGAAVGVVSQINSDTDLDLYVVGQVTLTGAQYSIVAPGELRATNTNGKGTLKVWIDSADNAMANITIGSQMKLNNFSFLTGTYQVENILEYANSARYAGSNDGNVVELTLTGELPVKNTNTVFVNLIHDFIEFELSGSYTISSGSDVLNAAGVTQAQLTSEVNAGDLIVAFDDYEVTTPFGANLEYMTRQVLGTVDAVGTDIALTANATITPNTPNRAYVRKSLTDWEVVELVGFVDDYAPTGATNAANYVTRPLVLQEPADSIRWIFEANIPQYTTLQVWYKTYTAGDNPEVLRWRQAEFNPLTKDAVDIFSEREVNVIDIDEFTIVQMKFVMKSSNSTYVPKVRNLRMITHS